ncbi:MAG TPA: LysM peptidoglycan-binding domain-containing protein [Lutibacter sp.]|nr:LysM peptidoglycan-binding domain-containing protein [Lutibacter sp.]
MFNFKFTFLLFLFFSLIVHAQTEPVKLITAEDIANDPSLHLSQDEIVNTTQEIKNDTLVISSEGVQNKLTNTTVPEIITASSKPELLTINLQDNAALARIDKQWMDLVKQSDLYDSSSYNIKEVSLEDFIIEDLPTELLKQRLQTIDAKTPFHVTYNPDLERLIKIYLKTRKASISNLMAKAKYYFPLFEEKLDKYDIPLEMKYLAIVESALRPKARSRVGATGLWQFMYPTGKQYGLSVSSYVDERQDPILATEAACKYLADLYNMFDDWDLALAAYNSGPGNVNKAIRRSGGNKNYWNLRGFLPRETASYVPIFYATMYLFEYAGEHNLQASSEFNLHHFEIDSIQVKSLLTFEQIQKTTGIDEKLLAFLNPSYKLDIIPFIDGKDYSLVLPKEYVGLFVQNEAQIYALVKEDEAKREKPLPKYTEMNQRLRYRVRSGDYLGKIASKYGVSVSKIKKWNRLRSNNLRIGQRLTIYPRNFASVKTKKKATKQKSKKHKKKLPKGKYAIYTVKQGDSLWSISQKYKNVSVTQIKEWNSIWGNKLSVGTKLRIYKG